MDFALTFALLLYFNLFYFAVYAGVEFFLLMFKAFASNSSKFESSVLINEAFILTFMVVVESCRLMLSQKKSKEDFNKNLANTFQILVLTVPSMYSVAYFTMWQNFITRLDVALGAIMLIIQTMQVLSSFSIIVLQFVRFSRMRRTTY